ncbi:MAG: glycosyl hydrolase [Balneolaceae bacterium]|nr:MAG: glycosyl hydrolase [Balneolaceae bacterium]
MDTFKKLGIPAAAGICYSGFRDGQYPGGTYPTYDQVLEDLLILQPRWKYLRMYDVDEHAKTTLEVIRNEKLDFKMLLGAYIEGEMNNFNCPWGGGLFTEKEIEANRALNKGKIKRLIELAHEYPDIVFSLSVGNEACVEWTDHYVHEDQVLEYVHEVRKAVKLPVTFCENYVPWLHKLGKLAEGIDFISIHTYPVWEYRHIDEAIDYTKQNYYAVAQKYPHKPVVITEAGWATNSNGRGINPEFVNETYQKMYFEKLMLWVEKEGILTFFFEAFDEAWKGSPEPLEPEKHWGLYKKDRTPKLAMRAYKEQNTGN